MILTKDQKKNLKAFFFDFDGTLVDSLPILKRVYMDFMKNLGHKGTEEEFQKLNGPTVDEIIYYLKDKYRIPDSKESLLNRFHHLFTDIYANRIHFFAGAVEFLTWARNHNMRLFIVTSADRVMVSLVLEKHRLKDMIESIISSRQLSNGKPHPEVYLEALKQGCLNPSEVIAFEDSENGLLAAKRADIFTIPFEKNWHEILKEFQRVFHE